MRKVHHAERAEDEGQAKGDQRIGAALVEPVQNLKQNGVLRAGLRLVTVVRKGPGCEAAETAPLQGDRPKGPGSAAPGMPARRKAF